MDVIVTPREASMRLKKMNQLSGSETVSERMFRRMCANGELVSFQIGQRWYINLTKSFPDIDWAPREDVALLQEQVKREKELDN